MAERLRQRRICLEYTFDRLLTNRTRFHGVFAPNSKHRARVTRAKRGKGSEPKACADGPEKTSRERRASMSLKHNA